MVPGMVFCARWHSRPVVAGTFLRPILPDTAVTLALAHAAPGELSFVYRTGDQPSSSGRALFG